MNTSILLVLIPCLVAFVVVQSQMQQGYQMTGAYPYYYANQLGAYQQQIGLYNSGNALTAQAQNAKLLNYLFGFLLLLQFTNATGNRVG